MEAVGEAVLVSAAAADGAEGEGEAADLAGSEAEAGERRWWGRQCLLTVGERRTVRRSSRPERGRGGRGTRCDVRRWWTRVREEWT